MTGSRQRGSDAAVLSFSSQTAAIDARRSGRYCQARPAPASKGMAMSLAVVPPKRILHEYRDIRAVNVDIGHRRREASENTEPCRARASLYAAAHSDARQPRTH